MSGQCVHIVIIWHLSLRALIDCAQKRDLGSSHFNPHPEITRPRVLKCRVSSVHSTSTFLKFRESVHYIY